MLNLLIAAENGQRIECQFRALGTIAGNGIITVGSGCGLGVGVGNRKDRILQRQSIGRKGFGRSENRRT